MNEDIFNKQNIPNIPLQTPPEIPAKTIPTQESIRTYESDMAKVLMQKKASAVTIAIAENKKKEGGESISNAPEKNRAKQVLMILMSIIFISGGVVGAYYLYLQSPFAKPTPIPKPLSAVSIIPSDKQVDFNISNIPDKGILAQIYPQFSRNILPAGQILELIIKEKSAIQTQNGAQDTDSEKSLNKITGSSFIKKSGIDMPDILLRSITDRWMIGAYAEESGSKTPFVVFTTDFFQNAFAGMLAWEDSMADDLSVMLNYKEKARNMERILEIDASSTPISSYFNIQGQFIDKQIHNRDVREFISSGGELLFLYSFIDKETFIMTTTETSLSASIDRIEKQTYVR
ncbi:MAG TPA: hypothetical protein VJJ28_00325 [Candidatus Paceibacterota bacterium]